MPVLPVLSHCVTQNKQMSAITRPVRGHPPVYARLALLQALGTAGSTFPLVVGLVALLNSWVVNQTLSAAGHSVPDLMSLSDGVVFVLAGIGVLFLRAESPLQHVIPFISGLLLAGFRIAATFHHFTVNGAPGSVSLALVGFALLLLGLNKPALVGVAQLCAAAVGGVSLVALISSLYGFGAAPAAASGVSPINQGMFFVLCLAILCRTADGGFVEVIVSDDAGGKLARRLLVTALIVPVSLGRLTIYGENLGLYTPELGIALLVTAFMLTFVSVTLTSAAKVSRAEKHHRQIEDENRRIKEVAEQERAAKVHGQLLQSVVDSTGDAVIVVDASGIPVLYNPAAERMLGRCAQHLKSPDLWYEVNHAGPSAELSPCRSDRLPFDRALRGESVDEVLYLKNPESDEGRWVIATARPLGDLRRPGQGAVLTLHDYTRLRQAEDELKTFFDLSSDLLVISNFDGYVLKLNPACETMLGGMAHEYEGKQHKEIVHPEDLERATAVMESLRQGTPASNFEVRNRCADGSYKWVQWSVSCSIERGLIYAVGRDVTESRSISEMMAEQNRELDRISRLKSQFLASMSHDLRTPLNAVVGFSDLLAAQESGPLTGKQSRFVDRIQTASRHLLQLINDILDLSKIEAGQLDLDIETIRLSDVLPDILSIVEPLAAQKNIRLDNSAVDTAEILADRVRLKQVLFNLLSNAVKFTPEGGHVRVEGRLAAAELWIHVSDNGVGISPQDQESVFSDFYQARTRGQSREGTGLGLAISKRLVEKLGGRIRLESEAGKGSCFSFSLPRPRQRCETTDLPMFIETVKPGVGEVLAPVC